jgi:acyl-Coa thioesterase superfamily protein/acyl-CoA thioesterase superfamily protein
MAGVVGAGDVGPFCGISGVTDCLYRRLPSDGPLPVFESTDGTRSNWDPEIQHGSPPLALMTKVIEEMASDTPLRIGRLTLDILGAIPVAPLKVRAWTARPGARISLVCAELLPLADARPVARVSAWLLATSDTSDVATDRYPPLVEGPSVPNPHAWLGAPGYLETVAWRKQATAEGAAAEVWMSPLVPVVDAEPVTDIQRLAMVVDSANGAGAVLDPAEFVFMNTDTTVHLHRLPSGTDFGLRARASIGPDGIGVTTAELFDRQGFVGTSAQTLLLMRR